ncbi:hypothetical protein [Azospirillum sp. sgz301742]
MANLSAERSPSGLFRMATWEGDMERSHAQMPRWYWNRAERYRQFARWVEAEADGMAMQLARHLRPDTPPETAAPVRMLVELLARDAAWARHSAEQSVERAA